jgi:hypothetical protein
MMKLIYKHETGIAVVHPTGEVPVETLMVTAVPEEYRSTARIVKDDCIPTDRTFRDAWNFDDDGIITEQIDKAKEIHKDRLRAERKPLFAELDVKYIRNLEEGGEVACIINEKQRLRDITKLVDKCKTIDEIKAINLYGGKDE